MSVDLFVLSDILLTKTILPQPTLNNTIFVIRGRSNPTFLLFKGSFQKLNLKEVINMAGFCFRDNINLRKANLKLQTEKRQQMDFRSSTSFHSTHPPFSIEKFR